MGLSDTAEPGGEGDGDNLLRDLEDTAAAGDKDFVFANECGASFIFSRVGWLLRPPDCSRINSENTSSLCRVTRGFLKPASSPWGSACDAYVSHKNEKMTRLQSREELRW